MSRPGWTVGVLLAAALAAAGLGGPGARAQDRGPLLSSSDLSQPSALAIDDPLAVFAHVLRQLPDHVQVNPTENYFYLRFAHRGAPYAGNIRLAAADRDEGKVNFAYGEQPTDWNPDPKIHHIILGREQGVAVEKTAPLSYRVSLAGRSVTFALNDLSRVRPPSGLLKADEKYLGPVFDESGVRFFLLFNARLKLFHFVLDDAAPQADRWAALENNAPIEIGRRTGFAFYPYDGRRILIGVHERQSRLNTYFDGPFDQLPENFIEGESLREAILAADPRVRGKIDRLGNFADGSGRYLIHPYMLYRHPSDLSVFRRCVGTKRIAMADRAACFVIGDDEAQKSRPLPLALRRR